MRRVLATVSLLAAAALALGASSASADTPIEGIWSFNGGKVGVQKQPDGTFAGTVVAPTKFAQCTHEVGERMWTGMTLQPDGSYWGLHQWFFEDCTPNPTLGPSAWRVLPGKGGSHFLRACFSEPGSNAQPTIAPDGEGANATFGCVDSALVAMLPEVSQAQFDRYVTLPGNKSCVARKRLRIRMRDPKNDPLKKIVVTLVSGKIHRLAKVKRHGGTAVATLSLKGLSRSSFTVRIRLTTVLGNHLSRKRTYGICARKKSRRTAV
jgi:hypothetical protein